MEKTQRKKVFQFTGLSGSGKTTLAIEVKKLLTEQGYTVEVLDGDEMRKSISADLGFSREDRLENMRRIARCAKESAADVVLIAAVNPYREGREYLRAHCQAELVWIRCQINVLKQRDPKGLYKKALLPNHDPRKLKNLTGVNDPFENPELADLTINTDKENINHSTERLFSYISEKLKQVDKHSPIKNLKEPLSKTL
ncbi:adenylyl-sulfate kinase [Pelobium manganitolerans]|uniref:adenylyl-sulfate kinase n=1 Tax=Pelobium manganitolerans TaxID=1842495 RepID=UPI003FA34ECF